MKRKFVEGGPSAGLTNLVRRSLTIPTNPRIVEEPKNKIHTQEVESESYPNKSVPTTSTSNSTHWHPFTDSIIGVLLPDRLKEVNRGCYNGTTDPDEHMDAYTMHMSLYTSDDVVLYRVFCTSLKGGALSWFKNIPPNFVDSFETLVSKSGIQFTTSLPHHPTFITLVDIRQEMG